ncbi:unnamed protein product [Arabidopsis thaliana]|uniref:Zinc finger PHD-type domain-containing protein n=1 Tax=Arabidopsis thaliana TaxID=3702 RepID=A0A5S9WSU8_ARATH|nr:unnamed protein product [Arabidopsis thaliana]
MDSIGRFHEIETDDKLYQQLVYYHPKYKPIPQTKIPTSSDKTASHDLLFQPLFLCPYPRVTNQSSDSLTYPISYSPEYIVSVTKSDQEYKDHSLLPLFWCNNKEFDVNGGCDICSGSNFGTDYYLCELSDQIYHKECVQSPFQIEHPYHPEHSLQLSYRDPNAQIIKCICCGRTARDLVYYCTICDVVMHTVCAMKSIPLGGFHELENDGKLSFVYHHPKYKPIPQTKSPTSSNKIASHNLPFQPLFLCPHPRAIKQSPDSLTYPINSSPEYIVSATKSDHSLLPLFWCNNKEFDVDGGCGICTGSNFGTDYYLCELTDQIYHKECVQSPFQIEHPYHPEHSLQLSYRNPDAPLIECLCCGRIATYLLYYCTICEAAIHTTCAVKSIPFLVEQPKSHDHSLTFFPRQASLTCNVCGLLRKNNPTFVCLRCNFVAHNDCMHSPHIIKISRHHHRISYNSSLRSGKCITYTSSLQSGEWSCGVCRKSIDGVYGAYTCETCDDYVVHVRCALRNDVWDGVDLQGLREEEEDDITKDVGPFEMIYEGVILHFLHEHHLRLEVSILYDENKRCQACVLPIFEGNFYSCMECSFILHETCAKARRRIQHALHPHPLTLKAVARYEYHDFSCSACERISSGFVYECKVGSCTFDLDVRCASVSEPFHYKGHEHPLFLALGPQEKPICQVCKSQSQIPLNCIKCDFIVCMKCATLPYKARYKCDKHFLRILCGDEVCEKDWCEVCERNLGDTKTKNFYWCNECCTTLHTECLLGEDLYLKSGHYFGIDGKEFQILGKSNLSRPVCDSCKKPCQGNIFTGENVILCSRRCVLNIV